jgi:hypothetical protein
LSLPALSPPGLACLTTGCSGYMSIAICFTQQGAVSCTRYGMQLCAHGACSQAQPSCRWRKHTADLISRRSCVDDVVSTFLKVWEKAELTPTNCTNVFSNACMHSTGLASALALLGTWSR